MIVSKLQGGLANQIFQWAYGKSLSVTHNTELYLDTSFYNNQSGCTPREFSLSKFPNLNFKLFNLDKYLENPCKLNLINDESNFRNIDFKSDIHYYLNGYWCSERYFEDNKHIIIDSLSYDDDFINKVKNSIYKEVFNKKVVSIHIRRTDYITSNGYHPVIPISYYEKALATIKDYDLVYVFSDDIEWCKNNLLFDNILFVEGLDDIEDMWLMSLCKNNIIANSTFSWWGAWLNKNPDKKVISPNNWFGEHVNINQNNIIPENWIKI